MIGRSEEKEEERKTLERPPIRSPEGGEEEEHVLPTEIKIIFDEPQELTITSIDKNVKSILPSSPLDYILPLKHISFPPPKTITLSNDIKKNIPETINHIDNIVEALKIIQHVKFEEPKPIENQVVDKVVIEPVPPHSLDILNRFICISRNMDMDCKSPSSYSSVLMADRSVLIVAKKPKNKNYEYIEFLERILRELYKVKAGRLPDTIHVRTGFERLDPLRANGRIVVIDVDEALQGRINQVYIEDRLRELHSQGLGYLVFYGREDSLHNIEGLWSLKVPQPIKVCIREDPALFMVANLFFGKIDNLEDEDKEAIDLDSRAVILDDELFTRIGEQAHDPNTVIKVAGERQGRETDVHYGIKAFVIKHLAYYENIPDDDISTEHEWDGIVLDVFVRHPKHGNLAIEVETLYGTGNPLQKLKRTIESRLNKGLKLWVVIPSMQFMLFLKDLAVLRDHYRRKSPNSVEFFTLDIYTKRLVSFPEIIEKLKKLGIVND